MNCNINLIQNDIYIVLENFFPINKKNFDAKFKTLDKSINNAIRLKAKYKINRGWIRWI